MATLRSFLGRINHYGTFPDEHHVRAPMDELLAKDQPWHCSTKCQNAFDYVKSMLGSDLLLTHFDPALDIIVAADASSIGLGAVISHKFPGGSQMAISSAARSLAAMERNSSQIEKEALAIPFAVKNIHDMHYGQQLTLLTGHEPLIGKDLRIPSSGPSRNQKEKEKLQKSSKGFYFCISALRTQAHQMVSPAQNGKIGLSMKLVDQTTGRDKDLNNAIASRLSERRKTGGCDANGPIELGAVLDTVCKRCGVRGHLASSCYADLDSAVLGLVYSSSEDSDIASEPKQAKRPKREKQNHSKTRVKKDTDGAKDKKRHKEKKHKKHKHKSSKEHTSCRKKIILY
ncbi:unnamed protein product [Echinostoma caproni]|uniref:CCHC-type domain-containing protein n=1 Tax=Echinostoma caproni TaxID=27848 RepID=A0A3P8FKW0_9TREM|nr:unnamed protein product [Echinostoma caproni]